MDSLTKNKTLRIAIQGGYGAFHDIAARLYFENQPIEIIPNDTFKDLFASLKSREADVGIMAIENSLAGSILPNYTILKESGMKIIGEIYLQITLNLVALPGQTIGDLREVYSHPMAILQSQQFFGNYPNIRLVDSIDTAISAKEIAEKQLRGVGAIASRYAAEKYNLEILAEGIESNKMNYTRFLIVKDTNGNIKGNGRINKSSVSFSLAHEIGGLSKILSILSYYNMNLTKIQSMPIPGKDWEYHFYVDMMFTDYRLYLQSLEAIRPFTSDLTILGEYEKGKSVTG
ncbi:MAG: prephenate dehydratase [Bacteroidales bacterium]|nr:prephenate dehydratase [Bacteroidales bacterium]